MWILDSGYSFHITPNKSFFLSYEIVDRGNVTMGNNTTCKVVGVGSVQMECLMNGENVVGCEACSKFEKEYYFLGYS